MVVAMSTDARQLAEQYYAGSGRSLAGDLAALGAHSRGVVVYMPQLVVLLKPVERAHPESWERLAEECRAADAWYIHLLVGDLAAARHMAAVLPPLRWLCFRRGRRNAKVHCLPWRAAVKLLTAAQPSTLQQGEQEHGI